MCQSGCIGFDSKDGRDNRRRGQEEASPGEGKKTERKEGGGGGDKKTKTNQQGWSGKVVRNDAHSTGEDIALYHPPLPFLSFPIFNIILRLPFLLPPADPRNMHSFFPSLDPLLEHTEDIPGQI